MKSVTTSQFWKLYEALPEGVQHRADRAYEFMADQSSRPWTLFQARW